MDSICGYLGSAEGTCLDHSWIDFQVFAVFTVHFLGFLDVLFCSIVSQISCSLCACFQKGCV